MTGYETFELYQALKLHFTSDSYDYFKYNGKSNVSVTSFENRKDKYHFYKLSRKYPNKEEMINFIVANFVEDDKSWVGNLLSEDAAQNYRKRQKVIQSLSYTFENDCNKLFGDCKNPNDLIKVLNGDYPVLLKNILHKDAEIETLCILNDILGFFPMWTKMITDNIRWPEFRRKIVKYTSFVPRNSVKCKLILKKVIDEN
jgi:hypothetical protein